MGRFQKKILLLGSGELGKEFTLAAKRLGQYVVACDRYEGAPAMAVADEFEVFPMLDGGRLRAAIEKHKPDVIIPEIEAIRTEVLQEFEAKGIQVAPKAEAVFLTMNREAIRDVAARELKLKTAKYGYAETSDDLARQAAQTGFPCVVKPLMSSSGKGQSVVKKPSELVAAWNYAIDNMRGDQKRVIVEEFIKFDSEITVLTVRQKKGPTIFVKPIGHRQERGDYQESWMPAKLTPAQWKKACVMAKKVTDRLGGAGLYGVEFFVRGSEIYFSELSPRPHDTGLVTLISQNLSEFELHLRAVLGLPIPEIEYYGPSASAVILADREITHVDYTGVDLALKIKGSELRIFGKPSAHKNRRMGVALARAKDVKKAVSVAKAVAGKVRVIEKI